MCSQKLLLFYRLFISFHFFFGHFQVGNRKNSAFGGDFFSPYWLFSILFLVSTKQSKIISDFSAGDRNIDYRTLTYEWNNSLLAFLDPIDIHLRHSQPYHECNNTFMIVKGIAGR